MKKITKLISVLALSSVALLFAGCAKDYSADIQELQDKVAKLEGTEVGDVAALKADVASVKGDIQSILADIIKVRAERDAADKALQDGKVDVATYNAKIAELESIISSLQSQLTAKVSELETKIQAARDYAKQYTDGEITSVESAYKAADLAQYSQITTEYGLLVGQVRSALETADAEQQKQIDAALLSIAGLEGTTKDQGEKILTALEAISKLQTTVEEKDAALKALIATTASETLGNAKDYADGIVAAAVSELQKALASGDEKALKDAKEYADKCLDVAKALIKNIEDKEGQHYTELLTKISDLQSTLNSEISKVTAAYQQADATNLQIAKDYAYGLFSSVKAEWQAFTNARIEDLRDDVIHYDIELYKKCNHELDSVASLLRNEYKNADKALRDELIAKINELDKKVDSLRNVISGEIATAKAEAIQAAAQYTDDEVAGLKHEIDSTIGDLKDVDKTLADRIEYVKDSLKNVINVKVSDLNTRIDNEVATLKTRIDSLKNADNTRISALEGRCNIIESALSTISARVDSCSNAIKAITSRVVTLEANVADLQSRMGVAEGDIAANKADIAALKSRVSTNEGDIAANKAKIAEIDARLNTVETWAWHDYIAKLNTVEQRVDKIENAVKSVSVLAPSAGNYEIQEYKLDAAGDDLAKKAAFHAKFQVRPAEAVEYLKASMLKLHVMEGVSRAALDAETEYSVRLLSGSKTTGIIDVVAFVPRKEIDANTYYFALAVVDTTAASTSNTLVMSDYQKAYYEKTAAKKLTDCLRWGRAAGTPDAFENTDYSAEDWYDILHKTGRSSKAGKFLACPAGKTINDAYVSLNGTDYITLDSVNTFLGEDFRFVKTNTVSAVDATTAPITPATDFPVIFEEKADSVAVNSWLAFRVDTISVTGSKDVRDNIGGKATNEVVISLKRASNAKTWATNLSTKTVVGLKKHVIDTVINLQSIKGRYWAYNTPVSAPVSPDTVKICEPYAGDTWDNTGFTGAQFAATSTVFNWGAKHASVYTTAPSIAVDATEAKNFCISFGVDAFPEYLVKDFTSIKVDNGHNEATFKFEVFATGIGNIVYKKTLDNVAINWTDNSKNFVKDPFLSAANSYYYTTKTEAGDTIGVSQVEIPEYTGRPAKTFSGIDYMFGEKYAPITDSEKEAYLVAIKTGVDRIATLPDSAHIQASLSWDNKVDESFFAFDNNYFEYDKSYKFHFAKTGIFGGVSKFDAYYTVNMTQRPFKLVRKEPVAARYENLKYHKDGKNIVMDIVELENCFEVVDVTTNLPYTENNGALQVSFTKDTVWMNINNFMYGGSGEGALSSTTANITDGVLANTDFNWNTYTGRNQKVVATLKYGPVLTPDKFEANKDSLNIVAELPYNKDYAGFSVVDGSARTTVDDFEIGLAQGLKLCAAYYSPAYNYLDPDGTTSTWWGAYIIDAAHDDRLDWVPVAGTKTWRGTIKSTAPFFIDNTSIEIDWSGRKSTHDGIAYDSPDDKIYLKVDGSGKLCLFFDKSLEGGEYIIYVPVKTKYYLNFQNGTECAKEMLNGTVNYAQPSQSTTLTIKIGTPRI